MGEIVIVAAPHSYEATKLLTDMSVAEMPNLFESEHWWGSSGAGGLRWGGVVKIFIKATMARWLIVLEKVSKIQASAFIR